MSVIFRCNHLSRYQRKRERESKSRTIVNRLRLPGSCSILPWGQPLRVCYLAPHTSIKALQAGPQSKEDGPQVLSFSTSLASHDRVELNTFPTISVSAKSTHLMAPAIALHSPVHSYTASIISDIYDDSDAASECQPVAVAVQPRRHFQNQVQMLENKARLTSIRSSTLSAAPSTLSQEPGPTLPTSPVSQVLFAELHSKPSSVLLGEENVEKTRLGTSSQSKTLRGQESSSTLRSFYDPQKLPLIVSQQTSDSSSRDFALRKDYPIIVTPESQRKHFFERSKSRPKSNETRRRKERADLSAIFPKPGSGNRSETRRTENPPYYKMHIKRPKAGTKHWFDSYDDEISDEEDTTTANFEPEMQPEFAEGLGDAFINLSSDNSPTYEQPRRQITPPRSMPRTSEMSKSSRIVGKAAQLQTRRTLLQPIHGQRAPSIPTPRATPKFALINPMHTANLKEQSVLFLSSDDEDDDAPALPTAVASRPGTRMTGGLRESLAGSVLDDTDMEIGEAKTVRPQTAIVMHKVPQVDVPKPYSNPGRSARMRVVVPDRRSSRMGAFFAEQSPPMHEDEKSRSIVSSSSHGITGILSGASHTNPAQSSKTPPPIEKSDAISTVGTWDEADSAAPTLQRRISTRLMPVTRQEQALLAAMRSKKATMRRRSVHQEGSESWQDQTERGSFYEHRPRTSADTNAPAFVELGNNNYADWMSRRQSSIMASQYDGTRASVTTFATTSQRASTRFSQYHLEESPETPASARDSALRRTSTGFGTHFSLSSGDLHNHSRSRTDSSHIVILDDLNDSPKDLENRVSSPRFPSWAYNRWSEGAEIAIVH